MKRLSYIDDALVERVLGWSHEGARDARDLLAKEPGRLEQTRYAALASDLGRIAAYEYATGAPVDDVRMRLREVAEAWLQVFERRGTEPPFPVTVVSETGDRAPLHDPNDRDFSLTNSRDGLLAIYTAIVSCHDVLAYRMAQLIWDPENAPYVGYDSEVCTPDDQHLARAVKSYIMGATEDVATEASLVDLHASRARWLQASILMAIANQQKADFLLHLSELQHWHQREAARKSRRTDTSFYLNLPALALAKLALRAGTASREALPSDTHAPLELVDLP